MRRDSRLPEVLDVLLHMAEQRGSVTSEVLAKAMDTSPVMMLSAGFHDRLVALGGSHDLESVHAS